MTSDGPLIPAISSLEERAFRRGRWMVLTLLAVTVGFCVYSQALDFLRFGAPTDPSVQIGTGLFVLFACWSALHGGVFGRACFILFYSVMFMLILLGTSLTSFALMNEWRQGVDIGAEMSASNWLTILSGIVLGEWSAYSLWVLILSKDAGLYLRVRHEQRARGEANAFEWPPVRRHQG